MTIETTTPPLVIHTDGACLGNPGPGGYAAVWEAGDGPRELSGGRKLTTNNRMELLAAIVALEALAEPTKVVLVTDSRYVHDAIEKRWLAGWQKRGWVNASKKPVRNADLWHELIEQTGRHRVHWHWVKGHAGHPENERVDALASAAAEAQAALRG